MNTLRRPLWHYWLPVWIAYFLVLNLLGLIAPGLDFLTVVKLSGIILCFVYTLWAYPDDRLLHSALFVTCLADLVLAVRNTSEFGIGIFLCAQLLHLVRLDRRSRLPVAIGVLIVGIALALDLFAGLVPPLFVLVAGYAIAIVTNFCLSLRWHRRAPTDPHARCSLYGFALFIACDCCVALSYLSLTGVLPFALYQIANFAAWLFYYPSQVLIANSSRRIEPTTNSGQLPR